jgi:4,5-DOPA dioxygenase extradiol
MDRRTFLGAMGAAWAETLQAACRAPADNGGEGGELMPAFFIGHGRPLNAIEDNRFTCGWRDAMKVVPPPQAILCISADARDLRHGHEPASDRPRSR